MTVSIVTMTEAHLKGFHAALDRVAKERRWLALTAAFPLEQTRAFMREQQRAGGIQLVAVTATSEVVGWCDILRHQFEGFRHAGRLGMGIVAEYRGQGIGRQLVTAAVAAARAAGLERIELDVFETNVAAIKLYEHLGFAHEGVKRNARKLDGRTEDLYLMALDLRPGF